MYLFISTYQHFKDPVDLCGHPHGQYRAQYITTSFVTCSTALTVLKEVRTSVTAAHNWALVLKWSIETVFYYSPQSVIRCSQVGTTQRPLYWQRGMLQNHNQSTSLEMLHWGFNAQSVGNGHHLAETTTTMIPLLLGSCVTKFLNILRYETPMMVSSTKYRPMTWLTATPAHIIMCGGWSSTLSVKSGFCLALKNISRYDGTFVWK